MPLRCNSSTRASDPTLLRTVTPLHSWIDRFADQFATEPPFVSAPCAASKFAQSATSPGFDSGSGTAIPLEQASVYWFAAALPLQATAALKALAMLAHPAKAVNSSTLATKTVTYTETLPIIDIPTLWSITSRLRPYTTTNPKTATLRCP